MSTDIDMLLLFDEEIIFNPPPMGDHFWIDNLGDYLIDNNGNRIVFKSP